ncbi:MAG: nitrate reductase, partial [Fuerstiella sp.]|nr:nitrate reductase [Fuerstiella sp.]
MASLSETGSKFLHQRHGPLTNLLLREPGQFGLGQVPVLSKPDAITRSVCGYCSTGCSLNVHLQKGQGVNLSPTSEYPVNLGMACPKGWESLCVLDSPERAVTPLLKDQSGRLKPVGWEQAMQVFTDRFQGIQSEHGPRSTAF